MVNTACRHLGLLLIVCISCTACRKGDVAAVSAESRATPSPTPAFVPLAATPEAQGPASGITHFTGEVKRGQQFEESLAPNLSFRLEPFTPASFSGWIIRIAPEPHLPDSSIGPVDCIGTVLERSKQSVPLSLVAPKDATEAQADSWRRREFAFIPKASDCGTAWDLRIAVFYPAHYPAKLSDQQREDAREKLTRLPKGRGTLRILDWRTGGPPDNFNPTGAIEWMKFEVSFDPVQTQGLSVDEEFAQHAIRNADFDEPMTALLAKELGGREAMEAACKDSLRSDPVEIENTVFGDLDGDGIDEAAVMAYSCQAGQSGPDLFAVFKLLKSGEMIELPHEKPEDSAKFKGKDLPQNLRGPWRIEIDKGRLIVRYLFWDSDAPKCGDADCTSNFVYHWDAQKLALADITQSPVN